VSLAYVDLGAPDAPPIVLLHALGESADDWAVVADRLLREGWRLVALDLRGHGGSDQPGEYSFDAMTTDVTAALDRLGLRDVVLVGHSMGGNVALRVAGTRPDLVARLVVEDSCPPYDRERPAIERPEGTLDLDWAAVEQVVAEVSVSDPAAWDALKAITAPTLVIAGGTASHVPQDRVAEVADRVPDAELVTIEVGHDVHGAAPDAFGHALLHWLDRRR
jgi:pimeloyl-ACP methyl ester carboxylesterase